MGRVGRWVDGMCQTYPEDMRALLTRPLGSLRLWMDSLFLLPVNERCGCLVGTLVLIRAERLNMGPEVCGVSVADFNVRRAWGQLYTPDADFAVYETGLRVPVIADRLGRDRRVALEQKYSEACGSLEFCAEASVLTASTRQRFEEMLHARVRSNLAVYDAEHGTAPEPILIARV